MSFAYCYEFQNFNNGEIPPQVVSTSAASFSITYANGYWYPLPTCDLLDKCEMYGTDVILRGGLTANFDYIPAIFGGNSKFLHDSEPVEYTDGLAIKSVEYLSNLKALVKNYPCIKFIELINEVFYRPSKYATFLETVINYFKGVEETQLDFDVPILHSEPMQAFTGRYPLLTPAFQQHSKFDISTIRYTEQFAFGEDYSDSSLNHAAMYHVKAKGL